METWDITTRDLAEAAVIPTSRRSEFEHLDCPDLYDWMGVTAATPATGVDHDAINAAATLRRFTPIASTQLRLADVWLDPEDFDGVVAPDHPAAGKWAIFIRRIAVVEYVNLTPHAVVVYDGDTVIVDIPTSGTIARLTERVTSEGYGLDTWSTVKLDEPEGLPAPKDGVAYIVSMPLAMGLLAGPARDDVVYPYGQVRDGAGRIVGCRGFARLAS